MRRDTTIAGASPRPIAFWLLPIAIFAIAAVLILPPGNGLSKEQILQHQSDSQLKEIGSFVLDYEQQHGGSPPGRMSELVPADSNDRNDVLSTFYAPNRPPERRPVGWETNMASLDEVSDYAIPAYSNTIIIAFERPYLWLDGTVAVCLTNLAIIRTNFTDLKEVLEMLGNPAPSELKEKVLASDLIVVARIQGWYGSHLMNTELVNPRVIWGQTETNTTLVVLQRTTPLILSASPDSRWIFFLRKTMDTHDGREYHRLAVGDEDYNGMAIATDDRVQEVIRLVKQLKEAPQRN